MRRLLLCAPLLALTLLCSCGDRGNNGNWPKDFNSLTDEGRVAYVMKNATPDSVARFICYASLGKVPGAKIDVMANAIAYAYDNYKNDDLTTFSEAYEDLRSQLPLNDSYRLNLMSGELDSIGAGYQMGLSYVSVIRDKHMTLKQVREEIDQFRKTCGSDTMAYNRFMTGFRTVLELDHGKDLPDDIYRAYAQ